MQIAAAAGVEPTSWHSYPKVFNLGHPAIADLFKEPVIIEEKVDGSQFSFGVFDGELRCRSKGKQLIVDAPEAMFSRAVEVAQLLAPSLRDGWTYRAEYLQKPKHNVLAYGRTPDQNLIIFDVNIGHEAYLSQAEKAEEAARIGLECVECVFDGIVDAPEILRELLQRESALGDTHIEGLVCKNYARFGRDGKALMGKHVSEAFKEVHNKEFRKSNPTNGDVIQVLCDAYRSEARWHKAIQHLRESGELEGTLGDIGNLINAVKADIRAECEDEIKERLYKHAIASIERASVRGLPEFYKQHLMDTQFE